MEKRDPLADIEQIASSRSPTRLLERLRGAGVAQLPDGRWLVGSSWAVDAVLCSPAAVVEFRAEPRDPLGAVQAAMARFSDDADHRRRRASAVENLAGVDASEVPRRARELTMEALDGRGRLDLMPLARRIPVQVLAEALGVPDVDAATAAVDLLCDRLAPRLDDAPRPDAECVLAALVDAFGTLDEATVNRLALLFQARDATAGFIGVAATRLLDRPRPATPVTADEIEQLDRAEPAVYVTGRHLREDVDAGGATIPAGATVVVALAAATTDPSAPHTFSFGSGARTCPGRQFTVAITTAIVGALAERGGTVRGTLVYEPRPNLRVPVRVEVVLDTTTTREAIRT